MLCVTAGVWFCLSTEFVGYVPPLKLLCAPKSSDFEIPIIKPTELSRLTRGYRIGCPLHGIAIANFVWYILQQQGVRGKHSIAQ